MPKREAPWWQAVDGVGDAHLHWLSLLDGIGSPERMLWVAVLVRAINDVALWHAGRRTPSMHGDPTYQSSAVTWGIYKSALDWFRGKVPKDEDAMCFLDVCEELDIQPEVVWDFVDRLRAKKQVLDMGRLSPYRRSHNRQRVKPGRRPYVPRAAKKRLAVI